MQRGSSRNGRKSTSRPPPRRMNENNSEDASYSGQLGSPEEGRIASRRSNNEEDHLSRSSMSLPTSTGTRQHNRMVYTASGAHPCIPVQSPNGVDRASVSDITDSLVVNANDSWNLCEQENQPGKSDTIVIRAFVRNRLFPFCKIITDEAMLQWDTDKNSLCQFVLDGLHVADAERKAQWPTFQKQIRLTLNTKRSDVTAKLKKSYNSKCFSSHHTQFCSKESSDVSSHCARISGSLCSSMQEWTHGVSIRHQNARNASQPQLVCHSLPSFFKECHRRQCVEMQSFVKTFERICDSE